ALEDLSAVMASRPDGIFLPKAEHANDAETLAGHIAELEARHGIEVGSTSVMLVAIETAKGLLNIGSYTQVNARVQGLSWGAVDLSATIGAISNVDEAGNFTAPYEHARTMTLVAAGACEVQAVDTAFLNFRDDAGLREDCLKARRDGFLGKLAIHPAQVAVINEVFMPSAEEVEQARAVVKAFADSPQAGSVSLNGKMLDKPHLLQAERTLSVAAQYGG
ncbi:MAG: CoA ester lyase, partial [Salinisphaeraceae bacterium]|nr:CoA ester lyase [Salinisphaeraceae bacterium]